MVDPAMNEAMAETALWATLALQRDMFSMNVTEVPRGTGSGFITACLARLARALRAASDRPRRPRCGC